MTPDSLVRLVAALVVIVALARVLGRVARRLGQPAVIGEISAGILLGPTLFGGALTHALLPSEIGPALSCLANVGVVVFMFLVGMELDDKLLCGQARTASSVAFASIALPFALGALLALHLIERHPNEQRLAFIGTAPSSVDSRV